MSNRNEYRFVLPAANVKGLEFTVRHVESLDTYGDAPKQACSTEVEISYRGRVVASCYVNTYANEDNAGRNLADVISQALYGVVVETIPLPLPEPEPAESIETESATA